MAKKCLVIGAETLSRTYDSNDRDSMIYSDGAGATVVEEKKENNGGILSHKSCTFSNDEAYYLFLGKSFDNKSNGNDKYMKMHGHKIYEFAISHVPKALKDCLELSGKNK